MTSDRAPQGTQEAEGDAPAGRQPRIPRPPTREELDEISRDQALITDEWGDEAPAGGDSAERPQA
ncbi:MAG TPA: hypothetical protein VF606_00740 [Geminicoccaceae bacterium]